VAELGAIVLNGRAWNDRAAGAEIGAHDVDTTGTEPIAEDTHPPMRGWNARYLVEWLFDQDELWITAKRKSVRIADMDVSHALNTILFLERNEADLNEGGVPLGTLQYTALYRALKGRVWKAIHA
jgi:hypothetical protein